MKLTVLVVACMAIVAVQTASVANDSPAQIAEMLILEKQRFFFEILYRMDHDLIFEEWRKMGGKLITDQNSYIKYDDWMVYFYQTYMSGGLLPRGEFSNNMKKPYISQHFGLFGFFYNAKTWETLMQNIIWARLNVNEGMFVNVLTQVVIHRDDLQGIILPQIYEIFPQLFLNSKYILEAEKFDWDVFNRQIMLEKEIRTSHEEEYAIFGNHFYLRDWKVWQWWKLMGLDDGWQVEKQSMIRDGISVYRSDPLWSSIYKNLNMVWIPADYTRDVGIYNDDSVLSYFTEDVGWNAYWYYLNMDYTQMLISQEFDLDDDRRGEWWIYNVQQLLARYYMERLSQGLGQVDELSWNGVVNTGYDPQLIAYSGNGFTIRQNYWDVQSNQDIANLNRIMNVERRIDDVIATGRFTLRNGTVIDLTQPDAIGYIGDLLQGNVDILDNNFFHHWLYLSTMFLSGGQYNDFLSHPNVGMNFETMMRDPLTYSLFKFIGNKFYMFKNQLPPYTQQELQFLGVKLADVEVSKLMTYFDLVDLDISTLLNDKLVFHDGKLVLNKVLLARQMRLNHDIFNVTFTVKSDKAQKVVIRSFLGPAFNQYGEKLSILSNRENFVEIDEFIADVVVGNNVILRNSEDFAWTGADPATYTELYNYVSLSYQDQYQYQQNVSQSHSLFPDRLLLPHGWVKGMPMTMFFIISPYTADYQQYATYDPSYLSGIGSGVRHIDNLPFGYPLDREIKNLYSFFVPNMFIKTVNIYHLEKYQRYFPTKYENFGHFDEQF